MIPAGAVDCDIHLPVPGMGQLLPYLDDFWRDMVTSRGMDRLDLASLGKSPMSVRPDWRLPAGREPDLDTIRAHLLDRWNLRFGICSCIHGAIALHSEDLGAAIVRAVNDWVADKWLQHEPRLRASILVHADNPRRAVEEIERRSGDRRFVQVLMLVTQNSLFGKRINWPIFEAAEKHDLPVAIHAGSLYRYPPSMIGWPSYYINDCVNQSFAFQAQLMSMLMEGLFSKFPRLRVVLLESGFSWLPNFLWRANKTWKGTRMEIPWVDRLPADIIRQHVRVTTQPFDCPASADRLEKVMKQIGSDDVMLFASDYPHWHFDGDEPLRPEIPVKLAQKFMYDNPISTYPRLGGQQ
jgi:uncharacterized protein